MAQLSSKFLTLLHFVARRERSSSFGLTMGRTGRNTRSRLPKRRFRMFFRTVLTKEVSWEMIINGILNTLFAEATQLEDLNTSRITRILTTDFPQYFAIITRIRQEVHAIGPEGGVVNSTVVPQVQAVFPQGALTKKIKVGLQVNMFRPRKAALANGLFKKITVNHIPKKKRFSLIW